MTENFTDGWTLKTLKELMDERDRRYDERDKRYTVERESSQKAVEIAQANAEKWMDNANEWRSAMSDKDRNFVTKNVLWGYFIGVVGLMLSLITIMKLLG